MRQGARREAERDSVEDEGACGDAEPREDEAERDTLRMKELVGGEKSRSWGETSDDGRRIFHGFRINFSITAD